MVELWITASLILMAGLIDDLRSRKVHNVLVITGLCCALAASFYFRGLDGTYAGIFALLLALIVTIPLFATGVLGGGDVKLFAVFAVVVDPLSMISTLAYSIVWGALFGLTRAATERQLPVLVRNTTRLGRRNHRAAKTTLHKIPFTFALLLGWFTQLTLLRLGGGQ